MARASGSSSPPWASLASSCSSCSPRDCNSTRAPRPPPCCTRRLSSRCSSTGSSGVCCLAAGASSAGRSSLRVRCGRRCRRTGRWWCTRAGVGRRERLRQTKRQPCSGRSRLRSRPLAARCFSVRLPERDKVKLGLRGFDRSCHL